MKKYIILIPIYNDRESLTKLIKNINSEIKDLNSEISVVVINDASSQQIIDEYQNTENIRSIEIINMKKNKGHARCIASGLKYIFEKKEFDYVIPMDGDGEDRPEEIKGLINKIENNPKTSVVAKRIKRSEGPFFQLLYQIHKIITYLFTGKNMNFGNFSCLTNKDVEKLHSDKSLWSSYSGTVKKNIKELGEVNSFRGLRYFGPSQMSLFKLLIHSFSIIAVFKYQVFLRSSIMIIILAYFNLYLEGISIFFQILIVLFNLIIFVISLREREEDLKNSHNNLKSITDITH